MTKLAWKPWHNVVQLREDLKSGELSLAVFAADDYDVMMGKARPVYQHPQEFFALTYPTFNLRELAKSESGKPSPGAKRFIDETTAADRPRVYRNALVLAVPSRDGLEAAKNRIREYLGWEGVRSQLEEQDIDPIRSETLAVNLEEARRKIPETLQQAYCIVITASEKNDVQAFKIIISGDPLFSTIKKDTRARIQETAISADAVLPGGPYDLWREDETARRVKDLVGAFAQFPRLPKMLHAKAILDTLVEGCRDGVFVLCLSRPDRSLRTWWREVPDDAALKDPGLEVVLPEAATLSELSPSLLAPQVLPGLWNTPASTFADICAYFAGGRVVKISREGYEEPITIPKVDRTMIEAAVNAAVRDGKLWLMSGTASLLAEEIPLGLLTDSATLQAPPQPVSTLEILPESLLEAWNEGRASALTIATALSQRMQKQLPWTVVQKAIDGACRARLLERTSDSGSWPCDLSGAESVRLRVSREEAIPRVAEPPPPLPDLFFAEADLRTNEIQDLADQVGELAKVAAGFNLKFRLRIELSGEPRPPETVVAQINTLLNNISTALKLR